MTKKTQLVAAALVTTTGLVGGYAWMQRPGSTPAPSNAELVREVSSLRSELSRLTAEREGSKAVSSLRAEVLALKARQAAMDSATAPSATPARSTQASAEGHDAVQDARSAAQRSGEVVGGKLDTELESEARDTAWGASMEAGLKTVFEAASTHRVTASECRTNLCRFTVQHDSEDAQRSLGNEIVGKPPFDQEIFFRYDYSAKPPRTTLYVARPGTSLRDLAGS